MARAPVYKNVAFSSDDGDVAGIETGPLPYILPPREAQKRDVLHALRTNIPDSGLHCPLYEYMHMGPDEEQVPT